MCAFEIMNEGERVTVFLSGEIDHHSAAEIRFQVDSVLATARPKLLVMDFSDVLFMDSSGIGLIIGRAREMQNYGGAVAVKNPRAHIKKIIDMAGISRMIV